MAQERVNDLVTMRDQGAGKIDSIFEKLADDKAELKEQIHEVGVACNGKAGAFPTSVSHTHPSCCPGWFLGHDWEMSGKRLWIHGSIRENFCRHRPLAV